MNLCRKCNEKIEKLNDMIENCENELAIAIEKAKIIRFMKNICPGEVRRECVQYKILNGIYPYDY